MIVHVNMSKEVATYYNSVDLDSVIDHLLNTTDFTNLPPMSGKTEIERRVNVVNPVYISLYKSLGPRSKKVSLGRLLEFGYMLDVLSQDFPKVKIEPRDQNMYLRRAQRNLERALQIEHHPIIEQLIEIVKELTC